MQEVDEAKDAKEADDEAVERGPSAALRVDGFKLKPFQLSIRNWDVSDSGAVSEISNFCRVGVGMERATEDGECKILKFVPIRKLQVANCEALSIF